MTVTYLGEKPGGEKATNTEGKRSYTRTFVLNASSPSDKAYTVGSNASLPVIGSVHPQDSSAYCRTLSVTNPNPYAGWEVSADYDTNQNIDATNPDNDEALITFNSEIYQESVVQDKNGNAIMNSANDPFDPPSTIDNNQLIVTISSNHKAIPPWVLDYQNAVNAAAFTVSGLSIGQGNAKVNRITVGSRQVRGTESYYSLSTEIHIKKTGWRLEPLDVGMKQKEIGADNQPTGKLIPIYLADQEIATAPFPLDGNGFADYDSTPATAKYLDFQVHDELDFTNLPGIT